MPVGRYEILETIGRGASSSVLKARDTLIGRIVALKTLQPSLGHGEWRERFLSEARILGQLSHPRIVSLYDVGIDESSGVPFLVMEYVAGQTLDRLLETARTSPQQMFAWGVALARALAYAHNRGIIHGDLKPANILVDEDGRVKLADFGIARLATHISESGLRGTPAFLSPEQILGQPTDGRSDLFSLGIVLYELATGQRPFPGHTPVAVCAQILKAAPKPPTGIDPALPPAIDRVLARCLAKNQAERYASGEELACELEAITRETATVAPKPARATRRAGVSRRLVWAASLLIVALFSSLAVGSLRSRLRLPPQPEAAFPAPKPPAELHPPVQPVGDVEVVPEPETVVATKSSERRSPSKSVAWRKAADPAPSAQSFAAQNSPKEMPQPKPTARAGTDVESSRSSAAAQLTIEIYAKPSDDTVVVFADHQVVFSTALAPGAIGQGEPLRAVRTLAPGQHHFGVALYKADKTLRTEKEALAELRKEASNLLAIRVSKRSKLFPLRGPGLQVGWPSETATSESDKNTNAPITKAPSSKF